MRKERGQSIETPRHMLEHKEDPLESKPFKGAWVSSPLSHAKVGSSRRGGGAFAEAEEPPLSASAASGWSSSICLRAPACSTHTHTGQRVLTFPPLHIYTPTARSPVLAVCCVRCHDALSPLARDASASDSIQSLASVRGARCKPSPRHPPYAMFGQQNKPTAFGTGGFGTPAPATGGFGGCVGMECVVVVFTCACTHTS